jgi:hypothetical protein
MGPLAERDDPGYDRGLYSLDAADCDACTKAHRSGPRHVLLLFCFPFWYSS